MSFESIRMITFDCYGTLIDWESGMLVALRPVLSRVGHSVSDLQILQLYGEIEADSKQARTCLTGRYLRRQSEELAADWE